jgi:hypothetical protein
MINYTERIGQLMADIVARVPTLSFLDVSRVLVFARAGRSDAEGPYATCHCVSLPPSEPGYYYWRDRRTGALTRRSEWFITKSPTVTVAGTPIDYMVSFSLPRFCDQSATSTRKQTHYAGYAPWITRLDTIVHELYHIDPDAGGIRQLANADGTRARSHGPGFYEQVADMVRAYLATDPDPAMYEFLTWDFNGLQKHFGGVVATTFRNFPSFPQRYLEACTALPVDGDVKVEPLKRLNQPRLYTEDDLHIRQFTDTTTRRLTRKGQHRAA